MRRKAVFLPYDFDTALGIDNVGGLAYGYNLEDTDTIRGQEVFNGSQSVFWNNLRDMYGDDIRAMYKQLRSDGKLSYAKVEKMFEDHQNKWPEIIFNEDAEFKYIDPMKEAGEETYLPMAQGSKEQHRKWWLYNRFRYIDSKFNAGDALSDFIDLRGYAPCDITVTPYADVYAAVKYGSYLVTDRVPRNETVTLACPLQTLSGVEVEIFSASQLVDVGDLSPLKTGRAVFGSAIRLTSLKLGDKSDMYRNPNLGLLSLGNNTLLKVLDVRNCIGLGDTSIEGHTQTSVDLSGCTGIEEVYFDGTKINGLTLPNGGALKKLHLPGTMVNLTIRNHTALNEFICPDFSHITTLWLENPASVINTLKIVEDMPEGSRVRLFNFHWEMETLRDVYLMFDKLDTMRGLDQNGNNTNKAQVYGSIHVHYGSQYEIEQIRDRYPDVTVTYEEIAPVIIYKTSDGSRTIEVESVAPGQSGTMQLPPDKEPDVEHIYTPAGWSLKAGAPANEDALEDIQEDRIVYAVYNISQRTYRITFMRGPDDGNDAVAIADIAYGDTASYPGASPASIRGNTYVFAGWTPELATVTGSATYTAIFRAPVTITYKDWDNTTLLTETVRYNGTAIKDPTPTRENTAQYNYSFSGWSRSINGAEDPRILHHVTEDKTVYAVYSATLRTYTISFYKDAIDGGALLQTDAVSYGSMPVYTGSEPTSTRAGFVFNGWTPNIVAVTGNADYYAKFRNANPITYQILDKSIEAYRNNTVETIGNFVFFTCDKLKTVAIPSVTNIGSYAFYNSGLTEVSLPAATTIGGYAFSTCTYLTSANLPAATEIQENAFNNCRSLTNINFPLITRVTRNMLAGTGITEINLPLVTDIDHYGFYDCNALTEISLPLVTNIGNYAFYNCDALTEIDFPSATNIGTSAFGYCKMLTSINLPAVQTIESAVFQLTNITNINLPAVTTLGSSVFNECASLVKVDLSSITSIGSWAFSWAPSLTTVIIRTTSQVCVLNSGVFNHSDNAIIYVPDTLLDSYKTATNWTIYADRIKGLSELPE